MRRSLCTRSGSSSSQQPDLGDDPLVQAAYAAGVDWLTWAVAVPGDPAGRQPVFGQGDANLANFLWDGERVRMVDFEDSGLSDRAFELAVLVEHISAWLGAGLERPAVHPGVRPDVRRAGQAGGLPPAGRAGTGCCSCGQAAPRASGIRPARCATRPSGCWRCSSAAC